MRNRGTPFSGGPSCQFKGSSQRLDLFRKKTFPAAMMNLGEDVAFSNIRVYVSCCCNVSFHIYIYIKNKKQQTAGSSWAVLVMFLFRTHLTKKRRG